MTEDAGCPLCGGRSAHLFVTRDRNRRITDEQFEYRRCDDCRVIFLANVPAELGRYYPDQYYDFALPDETSRGAFPESDKVALIKEHVEGGRLVEIGPGVGSFAYLARKAGFDVVGIEMDRRCCEHLRSALGVEAVESDRPEEALRAMAPSRVIAAWHVLEHLPRPWPVLESAARNLESEGLLVTAMPNPDAFQFRVLRSRWPHVDAPRHLYLIPPRLLVARAKELGLECVELTTTDPGGLFFNRFGWQHLLLRPGRGRLRAGFALIFALVMSTALRPFERRDLRGSTYTALFRKAP